MTETSQTAPRLRPISGLAKWIRAILIGYVIAEVGLLASSLYILASGLGQFDVNAPLSAIEIFIAISGLLLFVTFLLTVILFCVFSYRTTKTIHTLGSPKINTTPGWAVGWYFIPFANLFKPYGAMEDMWVGAHGGERYAPVAKSMPFWWGCWVISNITSNISVRMTGSLGEKIISDSTYNISLAFDVVASITGIVAGIILMRLVVTIANRLDARQRSDVFD